MIVDLPEELGAALKVQANARGASPAGYVCEVLQRDLAPSLQTQRSGTPFKTGRGTLKRSDKRSDRKEVEKKKRSDRKEVTGLHPLPTHCGWGQRSVCHPFLSPLLSNQN